MPPTPLPPPYSPFPSGLVAPSWSALFPSLKPPPPLVFHPVLLGLPLHLPFTRPRDPFLNGFLPTFPQGRRSGTNNVRFTNIMEIFIMYGLSSDPLFSRSKNLSSSDTAEDLANIPVRCRTNMEKTWWILPVLNNHYHWALALTTLELFSLSPFADLLTCWLLLII